MGALTARYTAAFLEDLAARRSCCLPIPPGPPSTSGMICWLSSWKGAASLYAGRKR